MSLPPRSRRPGRRCRPGKQEPCWRCLSNAGSAAPKRREALIRKFFAENKDETISANVFWLIGLELENHASTRDLAMESYECR